MRPRRAAPRRNRGSAPSSSAREWVGGSFSAPFFVQEGAEPYRPGIAIWLELPDGFVVGQAIFKPEEAKGAVARTLRGALTQPAIRMPRKPDAIRVADAATAADVREQIGKSTPVIIAPTPELDEIFEQMIASLSEEEAEDEASYLAGGRVSAGAVEELFRAASLLFALKPWTIADNGQVLRMDIPAFGVDGACVSTIGQFGDARGVLILGSLDDFHEFAAATEASAAGNGPLRLGAEVLALTFESAAELPPSMRREAMARGWPVASPDAYPLVERRDPDGVPRPLVERDVEIATACARSLIPFLQRNAALLASETYTPTCESYFDDDDREVRLTVPYEALADSDLTDTDLEQYEDFEPPPTEPFRPRAGRNEPCPCGSGRKYKKCHLRPDEARHSEGRRAIAAHRMDARLVSRLMEFAHREFGTAWRAFENHFVDPRESSELACPWSVYGFEVNGKTVVDAYLKAHGRRCSRKERRWLDAQRAAWLSVWEVEAVDPGRTLTLRDLLSDERRTVLETRASMSLVSRDALLARVIDHDGVSLLAGAHLRPLPPLDADEVVRRARARLRRKRVVPVERLQDAAFGRNLIRYWEEAVEVLDSRYALPPDLRNADGDPLLLTVDRFEVTPGSMAGVEALVAEIEGARREDTPEDSSAYVFLRPKDVTRPEGESTVLGWLELKPEALQITTTSQARADALRERVEAACGAHIQHRAREHADPFAVGKRPGKPSPAPVPPPPEQQSLAAEFKARHYAGWPDVPLPALNQKTPRECARTPEGREAVDLVLKHMENMEQRAGDDAPFDFSTIRSELGLALRQDQTAHGTAEHVSGRNR